jgi:hypothetical protein
MLRAIKESKRLLEDSVHCPPELFDKDEGALCR